ncbi:MAG TPA: hypothetical protein VFG73_05330 [Rhodanobacteraceae bacterium]|nr:hypothetical protein [Rhodanobacteraceae bacterium]
MLATSAGGGRVDAALFAVVVTGRGATAILELGRRIRNQAPIAMRTRITTTIATIGAAAPRCSRRLQRDLL